MGVRDTTSRCYGFGRRCAAWPARGFSLIEVLIVVGLVLILAWFVVPVFTGELKRRRLVDSIDQLQNVVRLTRAHAMNDGKRYRIRWPDQDAYEAAEETGETLQPIIEVEKNPIEEPGEFTECTEMWALGDTLYEGIQCVEVRMGRPKTVEELMREQEEEEFEHIADGVEEMFEEDDGLEDLFEGSADETGMEEEEDPNRPSIVFEPDGTVEWATILLSDGTENEEGELQTWEVIVDGRTGSVGWRRTMTEYEFEEALAEREEQEEQHKIVRGREAGAM